MRTADLSTFIVSNKFIHNNLLEIGLDGIFNNILSLTTQACESRFSQINIIGQPKHWRQTDTGVYSEPCDNTIEYSELALRDKNIFEVTNILEDKRTPNKQIIINDRIVRYYAALPLIISDGSVIGTICIMDCEPKKLTNDKRSLLSLLANNAASQVDLHLKNHKLETSSPLLTSTVDSTPELTLSQNINYDDLDEFSHRAAHDLKAPLNAIKNITSWIEEDIANGNMEDNKKHFSMINKSVTRMHQLLSDLRALSQIGREVCDYESINIEELVTDIFNDIKNKEKFDIRIESGEIELPKTPLSFVLMHLISNAVKHHDKGKGLIHIRCVSTESHYQITVTDDGPGIPIKLQNKVFGVFQKLKSKDEVEGSGLGLAMVCKTLAPYSAEISVNSQPNTGAAFTLIWPKHNSGNSSESDVLKDSYG